MARSPANRCGQTVPAEVIPQDVDKAGWIELLERTMEGCEWAEQAIAVQRERIAELAAQGLETKSCEDLLSRMLNLAGQQQVLRTLLMLQISKQ